MMNKTLDILIIFQLFFFDHQVTLKLRRGLFHYCCKDAIIDTGATFTTIVVHKSLYDEMCSYSGSWYIGNAKSASGQLFPVLILLAFDGDPMVLHIDEYKCECTKIFVIPELYHDGWQVNADEKTHTLIGLEDWLRINSQILRRDYGIATLQMLRQNKTSFAGDTGDVTFSVESEDRDCDHENGDENVLRGLYYWQLSGDNSNWTWISYPPPSLNNDKNNISSWVVCFLAIALTTFAYHACRAYN